MIWIFCLTLAYLLSLLYVRLKKMPEGTNFSGKERIVAGTEAQFFYDISYWEKGERKSSQSIFNEICEMIKGARRFLLLDIFLFTPNPAKAEQAEDFLPLTRQVVELLIQKKRENPKMPVFFITDPVNSAYGNFIPESLNLLKNAGIQVIVTDIDRLRDCNYLYGGLWFLLLRWFGIGKNEGWIPHPMKDVYEKVTIRAFMKALNARANHRKIILADDGGSWTTMITSANLHEASCWHSNVAVKIRGDIARDCLVSEKAVALFSGRTISYELPFESFSPEVETKDLLRCRLLTEKKIGEEILADIHSMKSDGRIRMCSLYLADPETVKALIRAANRGCRVEIVLDNNSEAFGQAKLGLPNQVTAQVLIKKSKGRIRVRMAKSKHEQLHAKMAFFTSETTAVLYAGSANFTYRNLGGFTLETVVRVEGKTDQGFALGAEEFFQLLQTNLFSYAVSKKPRFYYLKAFLYNFQQVFRLTTY